MALPAITNNSPSAGNIAWAAFSIQYQGVSYSISAGSTPKKWVWWEYRGGGANSVIMADDVLPTTLTDDDLVLFGNKNGIGIRVQATSYVDGDLLIDGSVFAEAIAANQINTNHIATIGLDAAVVKFGFMSGDRIAANTITTSKLTVGTLGGDLIRNGGFEDDDYWVKGSNASRLAAAALTGGFGMRLTASGGVGLFSQQFPCGPGDKLAVMGDAKGITTPTGLYFRISWKNAAGGEISITDPVQGAQVPAAWTAYAGTTVVAPAGTVGAVLQVYNTAGTVDIDDLSVQKVIISAQIGDGEILPPKIKAGEINTGHVTTTGLDAATIKFGTMHGDRITLNTLNSNHVVTAGLDAATIKFGTMSGLRIVAGTLTADRIDGTTFTGKVLNGAVITGGRVTVGAAGGPQLDLQVALNPFQSNQNWATMAIKPGAAGWNDGFIWGLYQATDAVFANQATASALIASPYSAALGTNAAARLQLIGIADGNTWATLTADTLSFVADTTILNSTLGSYDFKLGYGVPSQVISFTNGGGDHRIDFSFATFGVRKIAGKDAAGSRARLDIWASDLFLDTAGTSLAWQVYGNGNSRPALGSYDANVCIQMDAGAASAMSIRNWNGSAMGVLRVGSITNPDGNLALNGVIEMGSLADGGSSNSANGPKYVRASAAGRLYSWTAAPSSREMKAEINDADLDPKLILQMRPRTYFYKDDLNTRRTGFIAEEVDEIDGLSRFVTFEHGSDKPNGFLYDDFDAALLLVDQYQQEEIDELKRELQELRDLIGAGKHGK